MKSQAYSLICLITLVYSCHHETNNSTRKYRDTLVVEKSLLLRLDSTQGLFNNNLNQFEYKGKTFFTFFNQLTGNLHYYDADSGKSFKVVSFQSEGPDGIGNRKDLIAHLPIGMDSVFIYNGWELRAFLFNGRGEKLRTYNFGESDLFRSNGPFNIAITNDNRLYRHGKNIYINAQGLPDTNFGNKPVLLEFNLATENLTGLIFPPQSYATHCWGINYSTNTFSCYAEKRKEFIISYGIEPHIYTYSQDGQLNKKLTLGSEYFNNIKPYSSNLSDYMDMSTYEERSNISQMNPKYYKILYFPNAKEEYFIRETFLPRSKEEIQSGASHLRKTFIIADRHLQKIGEYKVPKQYTTSVFFTSKEGIYIADFEHYMENEGVIKFDLLIPQRVSEAKQQ